jgi:hypothetical protein
MIREITRTNMAREALIIGRAIFKILFGYPIISVRTKSTVNSGFAVFKINYDVVTLPHCSNGLAVSFDAIRIVLIDEWAEASLSVRDVY